MISPFMKFPVMFKAIPFNSQWFGIIFVVGLGIFIATVKTWGFFKSIPDCYSHRLSCPKFGPSSLSSTISFIVLGVFLVHYFPSLGRCAINFIVCGFLISTAHFVFMSCFFTYIAFAFITGIARKPVVKGFSHV